ncbi:hypothetical protein MSG28_000532 [Choristoneura fumiferana]|uniref:Uncharacterized protein n=1 Tax=Choristoneura fumiferana TaxID=7141 RepID=A0ACC0K113_CHOFU|nr:hypothetical protein MSG28_000532 [Choristoneura fumiferana]
MPGGDNSTMNQFVAERRLCACYGVLALLLAVAVVFVAVPYNHWRTTLNICPGTYFENTDCGCIFYGVNTFRDFNGGHNSLCMYATMAPIPILVYAIIMALFHMARVTQRNDSVIYCWIPTACIAAIFGVYNLVYAVIITDGFIKTCNQYRNYLVRSPTGINDQNWYINTGVLLQIAIICAWVCVALWIAVVVFTSIRAYKERHVLTCCGK